MTVEGGRNSDQSPPPLDPGIVFVRGRQVLLDQDLAKVYGVSTKALNQAVKRNAERFPEDFAFRPMADEIAALRSQIVTSNAGRGGARYLPLAFTEHGAIMAASVLNSSRAIEMSVFRRQGLRPTPRPRPYECRDREASGPSRAPGDCP